MNEYIVISLSLGGKGNKIFRAGDTVTEKDFLENEIPNLEGSGYIKQKDVEGPREVSKNKNKKGV